MRSPTPRRARGASCSSPAGGGKTAVVRRFCAEASSGRLLRDACDPLFTPRPLGPLLEIAEELGGELYEVIEEGSGPHELVSLLLREAVKPSPSSRGGSASAARAGSRVGLGRRRGLALPG
jgi:hypothetical protein